jgi:ABC-type lipoprotein export system ATPase subunit
MQVFLQNRGSASQLEGVEGVDREQSRPPQVRLLSLYRWQAGKYKAVLIRSPMGSGKLTLLEAIGSKLRIPLRRPLATSP